MIRFMVNFTWTKSTLDFSSGKSNGCHLSWFGFGSSSSHLCESNVSLIILNGSCLTDGRTR